LPKEDILFVWAAAHSWAARDELAVCASQLGRHSEAFALFRQLLAGDNLAPEDRIRIAVNRDFSVPAKLEIASAYPAAAVHAIHPRPDADVTVTLASGPNLPDTEAALNSILNSYADRSRISRLLIDDAELSEADRAVLRLRYPRVESLDAQFKESAGARLRRICDGVDTRFWLHVDPGWRFFAPERLLSRLAAILDAEPDVVAVAVNFEDATGLTGLSAADDVIRRGSSTGRYVLTDQMPVGPAMVDMQRLARMGGIDPAAVDVQSDLTARAQAAGLRTASLDEVLCVPA
jgi:hypothetical protein